MKKGLKITLWGVSSMVVLLAATVWIGPPIFAWMLAPDHRFGDKPLPAAPDYTLRAHWAAWPDEASPAERLPQGVSRVPLQDRQAAAFFLHPTTYGGSEHWVQPMDDEDAIRGTDLGTISIQASAFNGCCSVYAPRFRQSNIMGYGEEKLAEIMNLGFTDIRAAFLHFIEEIGPDQPFVLGSHSQGTFQMVRLIMQEIDGTPLVNRLVAAYAIGHSLPSALVEQGYQDIELCNSATQTGCFITWDAHEGDKTPSHWSEGEDGEQTLWNGTDYTGYAPSQNICINPITWSTDSRPSAPEDHLGALTWEKSTEAGEPLKELVAATVSAYCQNGERSNWLFVNGDRDQRLKSKGLSALFTRNLHGSDYGLFWANIRQNASDRSRAWLDARAVRQ
jgi:hypothetical protein